MNPSILVSGSRSRSGPMTPRGAVDAFDHVYNTQRPHQALPGRVTPLTAWQATPKADPPRPRPAAPVPEPPAPAPPGPDRTRLMRLRKNGAIRLRGVTYMVDSRRARQDVLIIEHDNKIVIADLDGTILIEHTRPDPGIQYVGNGQPRGPRTPTVTDVLTHQLSPMS